MLRLGLGCAVDGRWWYVCMYIDLRFGFCVSLLFASTLIYT